MSINHVLLNLCKHNMKMMLLVLFQAVKRFDMMGEAVSIGGVSV